MRPSNLYLYTLSAFLVFGKTLAVYHVYSDVEESETDYESGTDSERLISIMNREEGDPGHTDNEMYEFNKRMDKTVKRVNKIYDKELSKVEAQLKDMTDENRKKFTDRLYRKVSHSVFRDYGNFSTLKDGTFFGDMFTVPEGKEKEVEL